MFGLTRLPKAARQAARAQKKAARVAKKIGKAQKKSVAKADKLKDVTRKGFSKRRLGSARKAVNKNQIGAARRGAAGTTHRYKGVEGQAQRAMERAGIMKGAAVRNAKLGIGGTAIGSAGGFALGKKKKKKR